ncbi:MAG: hypothetical protein AB7K68_09795 [Bacteriovoracia bacterium]
MKRSQILAASFFLGISSAVFADDLPSAKDPAAKTDTIIQNNHTDVKLEKQENKFNVSKVMKSCLAANNNDKQLCATNAMAECAKSMSKTDCKKALKSARK